MRYAVTSTVVGALLLGAVQAGGAVAAGDRTRATGDPVVVTQQATTAADVREAWHTAYADEAFVHVLEPGTWPATAHVLGSNHVVVQVALDERAGRVVAVAAVDNLAKGTAGAAVQCLNLAVGLPESTGLLGSGVAP